jgi:murein DD-endopeptidase MepM/ murein hydrolase activator NlpD
MSQELDTLKSEAARQESGMKRLTEYFEHRNSILSSTPSIWPVRGFITSEFGRRTSPIYGTQQFHQGLDIANATGTPVVAPANGTIAEAGYSSGYGRYIKIQHGYGMVTLYGHLSKSLVHGGQRVKKGERIGNVGNTGSSTGPHLHYEVLINGVPTNPRRYI